MKKKPVKTAAKADPGARKGRIDRGEIETKNLTECLALDFHALYRAIFAGASKSAMTEAKAAKSLGILKRMQAMADLIAREQGESPARMALAGHASDTARGWAAFLIGRQAHATLEEKLEQLRPFADDSHFGVREWAWMAVRPDVAADAPRAIRALRPWTGDPSFRIRRFATEATRPRGVWAEHIGALKERPELGLPLLEPLAADPERYGQDSVANWLNDAAKSKPDWVRGLCASWRKNAGSPPLYIVKRASRSLK
jgi:3-methyladenine DNA glycosylase AlkC